MDEKITGNEMTEEKIAEEVIEEKIEEENMEEAAEENTAEEIAEKAEAENVEVKEAVEDEVSNTEETPKLEVMDEEMANTERPTTVDPIEDEVSEEEQQEVDSKKAVEELLPELPIEPELESADDSAEEEEEVPEKKKHNILLYVLGGLLAIIVLSYGVGVYYFSSHFFLTVQMNGEDIAGFTESEATKVFTEKEYDSHKVVLVEKDREETITPQDVSLVVNVGTQVADALKNQNEWLWFMHMRGTEKETITLDITYDTDQLKEKVDSLEGFKKENVVAPENAYIKAGETQFEIVPEVEGNTILKDDLITAIDEAFKTMQTEVNLEEQELYKKATVRSTHPQMNKALEKANTYAKSKLTYDFEYRTLVVDYSKFKDWIDISDDYKSVTFNDEKMDDYVTKLCADFNTMGIYRKFKTATGKTITITDGDYGWKIYYKKERAKLEENLKSGKEVKRKPIYSYEAMCREGASEDIGDTYVEVSISSQTVYLFVDGKQILSSPVVTGDVTKSGRSTHKGIYSITFKKRNTALTGQGYSSPVSYWMPFNGNEGLHDASWRSSFGGSIYKGNGSHGCVNCPPSVAKTIYENVEAGYPVIVY